MINMIQSMHSKCKRSKNTSASNVNRVKAREKIITNTRDLFGGLSTKPYVPAFTAYRISLSTEDLSIKEPPQKNYNSLQKIRVHNSNSQSFTQEVA